MRTLLLITFAALVAGCSTTVSKPPVEVEEWRRELCPGGQIELSCFRSVDEIRKHFGLKVRELTELTYKSNKVVFVATAYSSGAPRCEIRIFWFDAIGNQYRPTAYWLSEA
jgi:hypothetical protein